MSKEVLKELIDMIDEEDIDEVCKVLIKFIPEDQPLPDEIEAIARSKKEIENGEIDKLKDIIWE